MVDLSGMKPKIHARDPRVVTYKKRPQEVDMVLYDGSHESAKFIEEWTEGRVSRPDFARIVVPDRLRGVGLVFMTQGVWVQVKMNHFIIKGHNGDYYPLPANQLELHYVVPNPLLSREFVTELSFGVTQKQLDTLKGAGRGHGCSMGAILRKHVDVLSEPPEYFMGIDHGTGEDKTVITTTIHPKSSGAPGTAAWKGEPTFGHALTWLKEGRRVRRAHWIPNVWVAGMPALSLPPHNSSEDGPKVNARTAKHIGEDQPMECRPYLARYANGNWQPGWAPSQDDMFGTDWEIVPEEI